MIRFLLGLLLGVSIVSANPAFEQGLAAYNRGDWSEAISLWESLALQGETSPALELNLGNAYFRSERIEKALLHYERALKLSPNDEDAQKNLILANRAIVDQIAAVPKPGILRGLESFRDMAAPGTLETLLLLANGLLAALVGFMYFSSGRLRDALRRGAILVTVFGVLTLLWYGWRSAALAREFAIVMPEKSDVLSSPNDGATQLFSLHSGTKVAAGETLAGWTEITLSDGRKGWIPADAIERI